MFIENVENVRLNAYLSRPLFSSSDIGLSLKPLVAYASRHAIEHLLAACKLALRSHRDWHGSFARSETDDNGDVDYSHTDVTEDDSTTLALIAAASQLLRLSSSLAYWELRAASGGRRRAGLSLAAELAAVRRVTFAALDRTQELVSRAPPSISSMPRSSSLPSSVSNLSSSPSSSSSSAPSLQSRVAGLTAQFAAFESSLAFYRDTHSFWAGGTERACRPSNVWLCANMHTISAASHSDADDNSIGGSRSRPPSSASHNYLGALNTSHAYWQAQGAAAARWQRRTHTLWLRYIVSDAGNHNSTNVYNSEHFYQS